jgi:hypothetical protein
MSKKITLLIDATVNLILGILLVAFNRGIAGFLGVPYAENYFYGEKGGKLGLTGCRRFGRRIRRPCFIIKDFLDFLLPVQYNVHMHKTGKSHGAV